MADPKRVAEDFFDAWTSQDFGRVRALLHDDVSFEGRSTASATPTATSRRCGSSAQSSLAPRSRRCWWTATTYA